MMDVFLKIRSVFMKVYKFKVQKLIIQCCLFLFFSSFCIVAQATGLECESVNDIQQKYLNLHINFSNFNKKEKSFKRQLSQLEDRLKNQFIRTIDPEKIYFTASDVKYVNKLLDDILKKIEQGNCSGLNVIYEIYYKRVLERVQLARKYLADSFTIETTMKLVLDSDKRKRLLTKQQVDAFHKKYIQYQMAYAIVASDEEEYTKQLKEAKKNILRYYDRRQRQVESWAVNLSKKEKKKCYKRRKSFGQVKICKPYEWYSIYLNSFAKALDPHSGYLSQADHEDFEINMKLSLDGVGASLSTRYGHTIIERLLPGGAAMHSGKLKVKDKILAVGQSEKKMVNIFDMDLRDVVSMIRGKRGTSIYMKILRKEKNKKRKIFTVRLVRDRVNLEDQAADIFYFDKTVNGKKHKIGLLWLPSFYGENRDGGRSVTDDVRALLKEAQKKKVSALVLDLSNNGGGSLPEAVQVAGLFFARGSVVRQLVKTRNGDRYLTLSDVDESVDYNGPLVVLVNRASASASEIVSGTLKSYKRAIVVGGDHTFGKGSIQSVEKLRTGFGSIRVTMGLFFIPNGFSTQLKGVSSDIPLPSILSNDDLGEETLDYVLSGKQIPEFLSGSAYVSEGPKKWDLVDTSFVSFLKKQSVKRINKNKKFKEIKKEIQELEQKRKTGFATTIAEIYDKAKKEEEEENEEEDLDINDTEAVKKRYVERPDINEAINIAMDQVIWKKNYQTSR